MKSTTPVVISSSSHYNDLGRVKGSIEAAVERAFKAADADSKSRRTSTLGWRCSAAA